MILESSMSIKKRGNNPVRSSSKVSKTSRRRSKGSTQISLSLSEGKLFELLRAKHLSPSGVVVFYNTDNGKYYQLSIQRSSHDSTRNESQWSLISKESAQSQLRELWNSLNTPSPSPQPSPRSESSSPSDQTSSASISKLAEVTCDALDSVVLRVQSSAYPSWLNSRSRARLLAASSTSA